jgi:hypothetical protein
VSHDGDEREIAERSPEDLARLLEALHPTKEEDERAERFAARLLASPAVVDVTPSPGEAAERQRDVRDPAVADGDRQSWRRDILIAAIGGAIGVVATLIVGALT